MSKISMAIISLLIVVLFFAGTILLLKNGQDKQAGTDIYADQNNRTGQVAEAGRDTQPGEDIQAGSDTQPGEDMQAGQDKQPVQDESVAGISPEDTGSMSDGPKDALVSLINEEGTTAAERIMPPEGFERISLEEGSFGEYLRNLPLKPHGSPVKYFDGNVKPWDVHTAVIDLDVGTRDLQQCADAVIRLRAEYLYSKGLYEQIHFNFTNGFNAEYKKWMDGYRIKISGNKAVWVKQGSSGAGYESFRKYLDVVFAYAGTLSLSKEMKSIDLKEIQPGDVFLKGGSPGHCVIILDMAENPNTGERALLLAQSYMPAQDIHILKNPSNEDGDPWYPLEFGDELVTPEWTFSKDQVYSFVE